jgi:hypothetical protein
MQRSDFLLVVSDEESGTINGRVVHLIFISKRMPACPVVCVGRVGSGPAMAGSLAQPAAALHAADPLQSDVAGGQVIRFRPRKGGSRVSRGGKNLIGNADQDHSPVPDLSRYQGKESSDEYRHRIMVNAVAFAFTSILVVVGVWLALMMSHA